MSGKTSRMLRKMNANDTNSKRRWTSLNHVQRGLVRKTFKASGPAEATVTFTKQLFGRKFNVG